MSAAPHISVMRDEILHWLDPKDGGCYVDGTFGAGGHTRAILEKANCRVVAIDRDPAVEVMAKVLRETFGERFTLLSGPFSQMEHLLTNEGVEKVDGVLLDLGVSSMQLDQGERGFSFSHDGPLDMRMSSHGVTAADIIKHATETELADIIYNYGDERKSRAIARAIVKKREEEDITTTGQLANIVRSAVRSFKSPIDPATRTFQALRIEVNRELDELQDALDGAANVLKEGGRLAVITFHSGEDKIVKEYLRENSDYESNTSRYYPEIESKQSDIKFKLLGKKAIKPTKEEIKSNPRSRSAKLRVAERVNVTH